MTMCASPPFTLPIPLPPPLSIHPSLSVFLPAANIYPVVYLGSMQSWMSATHEFFCKESMVSRMYSPPFSTCRSRSHTELCSQRETPTLILFQDPVYKLSFHVSPPSFQHFAACMQARWCRSYLQYKSVVLVGHFQRHGGPHLHNG